MRYVRRLRFLTPLILLISALALAGPTQAQSHEDWSYNLSIYEVNVRQYTASGTLDAFETHLDRLEDLGVGILWFMPIHPIGEENRLGSLGSYYSVQNYLEVNPEFGTLDDMRRVVEAAHDRGMYVLIDWVANHTAWDNVLTTEHPEWYVTDDDGNFIPPPGTNWSDVIELDYDQPELRAYMIDAMTFWIEEVGVDGFRFDAVDFVPDDFWAEATEALRAVRPDVLLLAESDGSKWYDLGFDVTYGWGLYGFGAGVLHRIAEGTATAANLNGYMAGEKVTYPADYRMYFTSNHDENSWHGTTAELFGEAAEVFAVLTATMHGLPLIYSGQEAGLDERLLFFDKDQIVWRDHPNADLYRALLTLKRTNRALWNGSHGGLLQRVLSTNNTDVFAFMRERGGDRVFVASNLSNQEQQVTLEGSSYAGAYRDVFTGEDRTLEAGETLTLGPWSYRVYEDADTGTAVGEEPVPAGYTLSPNHPNPFRTSTTIEYELAEAGPVTVRVYNLLGEEVAVLVDAVQPAGSHTVRFDAGELSAGVYVCVLEAGARRVTRPMVRLQ